MKIQKTQLIAIALLASTQASAEVATIEAGQTVALSGITHAEDPTLGGVVVADYSQDFVVGDVAGDPLIGTLHSRVSERFDTGELDFSWRISGIESELERISSVVLSGYQGWELGVEWRIDSTGEAGPSHAMRSEDDDSIGYLFAGTPLNASRDSHSFFARTQAFDFETIGTARINLVSGYHITLSTFAPTIPTPGGLAMLGIGGLVTARRRR